MHELELAELWPIKSAYIRSSGSGDCQESRSIFNLTLTPTPVPSSPSLHPDPLDPLLPSTGSPTPSFLFRATISTLPFRNAALLRHPSHEELGFPHPVVRITISGVRATCCRRRVCPAAAGPPGTRHLESDACQHREAMGGHAPSGAGRSLDVT
jgi:hypothetical protein